MAHIKPEHLLEPRDYRQWLKVTDGASESAVDDDVFESVSKRAWMDVLLQIIKVLHVVLPSFIHPFTHVILSK